MLIFRVIPQRPLCHPEVLRGGASRADYNPLPRVNSARRPRLSAAPSCVIPSEVEGSAYPYHHEITSDSTCAATLSPTRAGRFTKKSYPVILSSLSIVIDCSIIVLLSLL